MDAAATALPQEQPLSMNTVESNASAPKEAAAKQQDLNGLDFVEYLGPVLYAKAGGPRLYLENTPFDAARVAEYEERADKYKESSSRKRIRRDLSRTFHAFAHATVHSEDELERILCALTLDEAPDTIKYCQGMNFVAGFLLTRFKPVFVYAVTKRLLVDRNLQVLFQSNSPALSHYIDHFHALLTSQSPSLAMHLSKHDFGPSLYAVEWFTTIYTTCVSAEAAELLLAIIHVGEIDNLLLRFGVAILLELEASLLRMKFEAILSKFKPMVKALDFRRVFQRALTLPSSADVLLLWRDTGGPEAPATFHPGYRSDMQDAFPGWTKRRKREAPAPMPPASPQSSDPTATSSPLSTPSTPFPDFPAHITDSLNPLTMDVLSGKLGSMENLGFQRPKSKRLKYKSDTAFAEETCFQEMVASWDDETRTAVAEELATRIDISIWQYVMVEDHVEYQILITDKEAGLRWCVFRRYSEFHRTHLELIRLRSKDLRVPRLPPKRWFGNLASRNIIHRFEGLQRYIAGLFPPIVAPAASPPPPSSEDDVIMTEMAHDAYYLSQLPTPEPPPSPSRSPSLSHSSTDSGRNTGAAGWPAAAAAAEEGPGPGIMHSDGRRRRVRIDSTPTALVPASAAPQPSPKASPATSNDDDSQSHVSTTDNVAVMKLDLASPDVVVPVVEAARGSPEQKKEAQEKKADTRDRGDAPSEDAIRKAVSTTAVGIKRHFPPSHPSLQLNFSDDEDDEDTEEEKSSFSAGGEDAKSMFSLDGLVANDDAPLPPNAMKQRAMLFSLPVVLAFYRLDAYILDCFKFSKSRLSAP